MAGNGTDLVDLPGNINKPGPTPDDISAEILATSLEIERDTPDAWQPVGVPVRRVVARALAKARRRLVER